MPADDLYWNPMDLDSDDSFIIQHHNSGIDPWDLENYAYIKQHLDSNPEDVTSNSLSSSLGEAQETSAFYYIPARPVDIEPVYMSGSTLVRTKQRQRSHENYAAIDEMDVNYQQTLRRRNSGATYAKQSENYDDLYDGAEYEFYGGIGTNKRQQQHGTMHLYETNKSKRNHTITRNMTPVVRRLSKSRRHSYSVGEYDCDSNIYNSQTGSNNYKSPQIMYKSLLYGDEDYYNYYDLYDDVRSTLNRQHRNKPRHFQLSNYGHLQIDYSCNWNNLTKYIYN